jgi:hypothetical protein
MTNIHFEYISKYAFDVCEKPVPSSAYVPEWLRLMTPYEKTASNPDGKKFEIIGSGTNATPKKCIPMLDGIISGYTIPLWSDVHIEQSNFGPRILWKVKRDVFQSHARSAMDIPPPIGFSNYVFKYLTWFRMITPPGYSVLVKPVVGHQNLPIQAMSAIIDTDRNVIDSNLPVWISESFEGILEKGTPIAQIFPFKREKWESSFSWISDEEYEAAEDKGFLSTLVDNYRKNIWSKKEYR